MSQTSRGARKATRKLLKNNPNYFSELGSRNKGVPKSIPTGFKALKEADPELHIELSAKGGRNKRHGNRDTSSSVETDEMDEVTPMVQGTTTLQEA